MKMPPPRRLCLRRIGEARWAAPIVGAAAFAVSLALSGCKEPLQPAIRPETPPQQQQTAPPVVHAPPVETRPYEEGYAAGYEEGKRAARPRAKLPAEEEIAAKTAEAAGNDPDRNERWQRGWASGYKEGFTQVATGRK